MALPPFTKESVPDYVCARCGGMLKLRAETIALGMTAESRALREAVGPEIGEGEWRFTAMFECSSCDESVPFSGRARWVGSQLHGVRLGESIGDAMRRMQSAQVMTYWPERVVEATNSFVRSGNTWTICFAGQTVHLPHLRGLTYLHALIQASPEPVAAKELAAIGRQGSGDGEDLSETNRVVKVDQRERKDMQKQLARVRSLLAGDPADADELRRAEQHLVAQLKVKRLGIDGNDRWAVGKAITKALDEIAEASPELHAHFKDCLMRPTGTNPCYQSDTRWLL